MAQLPNVSIDKEADAAYLTLADGPVVRSADHDEFVVDFDTDGRVVGVEVLTLQQLPSLAAIMKVFGGTDEAVRQSVVSFVDQLRAQNDTTSESWKRPEEGDVYGPAEGSFAGSVEEVRLLTVAEVATVLRVSRMTVYRLVHTGVLPALRVSRGYRIPEQAVRTYLRDTVIRLEAMT